MPDRTDLAYSFDGTFAGVLCCIFDSYTRHEIPAAILLDGEPSLYPVHSVMTDQAHAARVWKSLLKIGGEVPWWTSDAWLSGADGREEAICAFVRRAYQCGVRVTGMYADPAVDRIFKLSRAVRNEAHYYKEFLRFSDYNGALVSEIEPKAMVLPHIRRHYAERLPEETFLIFDRTHGQALFYRPYEAVIQEVEDLELPPADENEQAFRKLWRHYYDTIGVEGRYNPECRRNHMPKHFWKHMTEMYDKRGLPESPRAPRPLEGTMLRGLPEKGRAK